MEKRAKAFSTVNEYVMEFPKDVQRILGQIRHTIQKAVPGATEKISYQMPSYSLNGKTVYFAAHAHHIGLYPGAGAIAAFKNELSGYKSAKGSVQFPLDTPMPFDLIERMVIYRIKDRLTPRS